MKTKYLKLKFNDNAQDEDNSNGCNIVKKIGVRR